MALGRESPVEIKLRIVQEDAKMLRERARTYKAQLRAAEEESRKSREAIAQLQAREPKGERGCETRREGATSTYSPGMHACPAAQAPEGHGM